jgi:RsiW-degrading membrane proteinase PrsW (M82 family)
MTTATGNATTDRRLWLVAGWLLIGYIVLTFAGVGFEHSLMLGDTPAKAKAALVDSSLSKNFAGGYVEYLATLLLLLGGLLVARLLRSETTTGGWLSSVMTAAVTIQVAITVAVGFAAGAAALYDAHHGASLATATTINDIRNFAFFLTGGLAGIFAISASAAVLATSRLPRWVAYFGIVVGVLSIATIPAARTGVIDVATMLGFVWIVALAVTSLRRARTVRTGVPVGSAVGSAA